MATEQQDKPNLTNSAAGNTPLIFCDTKQQKDFHIVDHFDRKGIPWKRVGLPSGDYQVENDYTVIIDTKANIAEMCKNLTGRKKGANGKWLEEHARIVREIDLAKSLGCTRFIFLISDTKIKFVEEVYTWKRPMDWKTKKYRTKVLPETLQKIMITFAKNHDCEFMFCTKLQMGRMVASLLLDRGVEHNEARQSESTTI